MQPVLFAHTGRKHHNPVSRPQMLTERMTMKKLLLVLCVALSACSTDNYIKEDGTQVTIKKAAGVPYVVEEEKTEVVPMGSY
jgi:hypothetical protein